MRKKWMTLRTVFVFPGIVLPVLLAHAQPFSPQMRVVHSQPFLIYYHFEDEKNALRVAKVLQAAMPRMEQFYHVHIQPNVPVYITRNLYEFQHFSRAPLPSWAGALFIPRQKIIVVKSPRWQGDWRSLSRDLAHELSHLYFSIRFGSQKLPTWFNEGLAEYLSRGRIHMSEAAELSRAIWFKNLIAFSDFDSLFQFSAAKAHLAYLESHSIIHFMSEQLLPAHQWEDFLSAVQHSGFDHAVQQFFHCDLIDFEIRWYHWLEHKYRWMIILSFDFFFWVFLIIILILALLRTWYRNRKRMQDWEREEAWRWGEGYGTDSGQDKLWP